MQRVTVDKVKSTYVLFCLSRRDLGKLFQHEAFPIGQSILPLYNGLNNGIGQEW
jgi:hypothetical protein